MEKLINLLRERKPNFDENHILDMMYSEGTIFIKDGKPVYTYSSIGPNTERMIINGKIGFIKRLVDNNKIDFDKCGLDVRHYLSYNKRYDKGIVMAENYDNDTFVVREFYSPYEQLLMLLAISENPIEDLLLYLK